MASSASKRLEIFIATGLFIIGVSIYLLWRDEHLLIHRVIHGCGIDTFIAPLRRSAAEVYLPEWIRFALPDGLWTTSYILLIDALVKRDYQWTSVIPLVGLISEIMQWIGWMPGTFDICDLIAYVLPYLFYVMIINQYK